MARPKFAQLKKTTLIEGIAADETGEFRLKNLVDLYGNAISISDLTGEGVIYFTFNPGGENEEIISATDFTLNGDDTVTVDTGIVRALAGVSPYATGGTARDHAAGTIVVVSNTPQTMEAILDYIDAVSIAGAADATLTGRGIVEMSTTAEIDADEDTGGTGASLAIRPDQLATSKYGTRLPTADEKAALAGSGTPSASNKFVTENSTKFKFGGTGADGALTVANPTGTIASTSGTSVVGTGTLFLTEFSVGDKIICSGQTKIIATITDNTNLTTTVAFSPTVTGTMYKVKVFNVAGANLIKNYTDVSITGNSYIEFTNKPITGLFVYFKCTGTFTATTAATNAIVLVGMGADDGQNGFSTFSGSRKGSAGAAGGGGAGGAGGGGGGSVSNNGTAGEAGGGGATAGTGGIGASLALFISKTLGCGGSGGAGGLGNGGFGSTGAGGAGGGCLYVECASLNITAAISANGSDGNAGTSSGAGGNGGTGGGAGGQVVILTNLVIVNTPTITVAGGAGGAGGAGSGGGTVSGAGGAGGVGYSYTGLNTEF